MLAVRVVHTARQRARRSAAALDGQLVNAGPFVLQEALFKNDLDLTFGDSQLRTAAACFYNATIF